MSDWSWFNDVPSEEKNISDPPASVHVDWHKIAYDKSKCIAIIVKGCPTANSGISSCCSRAFETMVRIGLD